MAADLVFTTLWYTGVSLLVIAVLASPLLFLARGSIRAWISRGRWRLPGVLAIVLLPLAAWAFHRALFAPILTYSPGVAKFWIRRAAEAPTREERVRLVRRVAASSSEYGAHVAWGAIRDIPDRKMRCDLYDIVATTPHIKSSLNVHEALQKECTAAAGPGNASPQ